MRRPSRIRHPSGASVPSALELDGHLRFMVGTGDYSAGAMFWLIRKRLPGS
jgi:hypothetical protein